jgi:hypothetical protein
MWAATSVRSGMTFLLLIEEARINERRGARPARASEQLPAGANLVIRLRSLGLCHDSRAEPAQDPAPDENWRWWRTLCRAV